MLDVSRLIMDTFLSAFYKSGQNKLDYFQLIELPFTNM